MKFKTLLALTSLATSTAYANVDNFILSQPICNQQDNTKTCTFDVFTPNNVFIETIKISNTDYIDRSMLQVHGVDSSSYRVCLKDVCKEYDNRSEALLALEGRHVDMTRKKRRVRLPNSGSPFFMNECVKAFEKVGKEVASKRAPETADGFQLAVDLYNRSTQTQQVLMKIGYELYVKEHVDNIRNYGTLNPSQSQRDHRAVHNGLAAGGRVTDRQPKGSAGDTGRYALTEESNFNEIP